jgi:ubiquinone/menaquinone biosynthesis C-methylase UbiE
MSEPASWDASAREYDSFEKKWHHYENVARKLVDSLEIEPRYNILELACGTGACTMLLANSCKNGEIFAIDQSQNMIDVARQNISNAGYSNVTLMPGEVGQLATLFRSKSQFFDVAACNSAFWHFPDQRQVLNNLHYLLKSYGRFGFSLSEWFASEETREQYRKMVQEILSSHGIDTSRLAGSSSGRRRVDYAFLIQESGFRVIKDEHYDIEMPEGARTAWREIPRFSRVASSIRSSAAVPENVREEIRNEIRRRRDLLLVQSRWTSRWRILVAEKSD